MSGLAREPELVMTLPGSHAAQMYGRHTRTTLGVLTQLMVEASNRVILAAPFMQSGAGLSDGPLSFAVAAALRRGVEITVLGTRDGLATLNLPTLMEGAKASLRTYVPAPHLADASKLGSHAKFCVADGLAAYVGSANYTGPGLGSQLELGVLVHGNTARLVDEFWTLGCLVGFFVPEGVYVSGR